MPKDDLYATIREEIKNTKDNGYTFDGWTYLEIATDLVIYSSPFEGFDPDELQWHVKRAMTGRSDLVM